MRWPDRISVASVQTATLAVLAPAVLWSPTVAAQTLNPHHEVIGGPWEIVVKLGLEGDTLRSALAIADENKAQTLDQTLPVAGTPLEVRLERYLPDLERRTVAAADPNGAAVARLSLRGANLSQDLWLDAGDISRQSVSANVGGVAIRELPGGPAGAVSMKALADAGTVGVLLVWLDDASDPLQYAVRPPMRVQLPGGQGTLSVPRYVPHYSVDRETGEVTSASDQPVNPAVEVRVEGPQGEYDQWVWSKFPSSPHMQSQLPFRARFIDFHVPPAAGQYMLAVAEGLEPQLLHWQDQRRVADPVVFGQRYPFSAEGYSLGIEEVQYGAKLENRWASGSEMLLHPAVVASIVQGGSAEEVILELNEPNHQATPFGTLVMFYRRVP